jgi:hypothetical protein
VADAAVVQARRHSRRGELGRALGELARATAYVPRHAEAEKLVASISWRRRWLKVTGVAAAIAAVASAGFWLGPRVRELVLRAMRPEPVVAVEAKAPPAQAPATEGAAKSAGIAPADTSAAAVVPVATSPAQRLHASTTSFGKRNRDRKKTAARVAKAESAAEEAPAPEPVDETPPEPAPPVVEAPPPQPRRVPVEIYASRGVCSPSLDDLKVSVSPAKYAAVTEGEHTVYCNWAGRPRVKVGTVHVGARAPGDAFKISIRQDEQSKQPVLGASKTTGPRQPDPGAEAKPAQAGDPAR